MACWMSSATTSLSLLTVPGRMPASTVRAAVLVRLPLWPSARPPDAVGRNVGWAFFQTLAPVVE